MRILVLDDNRIIRAAPDKMYHNPHDFREDEFVQTRSVRKFVELFFKETWDLVWIDHDLGTGKINGRTATRDIYNYICGSNRKSVSQPKVWITTMNPSVGETMLSDLKECGFDAICLPISSLYDQGISRGEIITD